MALGASGDLVKLNAIMDDTTGVITAEIDTLSADDIYDGIGNAASTEKLTITTGNQAATASKLSGLVGKCMPVPKPSRTRSGVRIPVLAVRRYSSRGRFPQTSCRAPR